MNLVEDALFFAQQAHKGQVRKYTGDQYITHPIAVSELVKNATYYNQTMLAAALLHDTVEDTGVGIADIDQFFGACVASLVSGLTNAPKVDNTSRWFKKYTDRQRLEQCSGQVHTIKLADVIHNSQSIIEHDPEFAKVYIPEMGLMLLVLTSGCKKLHGQATKIVTDYRIELSRNPFNA